jgi:hypothetical protein
MPLASNTAHFTCPLVIQNWLPKSLPHLHGSNSPDCFPFLHTSSTPLKWFKCFQSSHDQNKNIKSITLQTTEPVAMSPFRGIVKHNENQDALLSSEKKVTVTFLSKKLRVTKSLGQCWYLVLTSRPLMKWSLKVMAYNWWPDSQSEHQDSHYCQSYIGECLLPRSSPKLRVVTSVGRFSLFCENRLVPVLTSCYENLIDSLIYFFLGLVRIDQDIKFFIFFKFTWFSNRVVFAYLTTISFQIQFS